MVLKTKQSQPVSSSDLKQSKVYPATQKAAVISSFRQQKGNKPGEWGWAENAFRKMNAPVYYWSEGGAKQRGNGRA